MPGLYLELGIPWGTRNTRSLFSRSLSSSVGNQMSMQTKNGKCNEGAAPAAQVVGGYLSEAASSKLRAKHKLKKQVRAEEEERCWRGCGPGELAAQLRLRPRAWKWAGPRLPP